MESSPLPSSSSFSSSSSSSSSGIIISKLRSYLSQNPSTFEITILPVSSSATINSTTTTTTTKESSLDDDDNDKNKKSKATQKSKQKLKRQQQQQQQQLLSLDESLILIENHLGLDARSLPWMTKEIRKEYYNHRSRKNNLLMEKSSTTDDDFLLGNSIYYTQQLFQITSCLLLVNPDHSTVWSDRRKCLLRMEEQEQEQEQEQQQRKKVNSKADTENRNNKNTKQSSSHHIWEQELNYINLLMTQHSKAPSSWGHRKYVLQKVLLSSNQCQGQEEEQSQQSAEVVPAIIRKEIEICTKIAEAYPKNYYAWTHRRYLWTLILLSQQKQKNNIDKIDDDDDDDSYSELLTTSFIVPVLQEEFITMIDWLDKHVSDHSAAHYGGQILQLWLSTTTLTGKDESVSINICNNDDNNIASLSSSPLSIVELALSKSRGLVQQNSYHYEYETPWIFRRIVISTIIKYCQQQQQQQQQINCNDNIIGIIMKLVLNEIESVHNELIQQSSSSSSQLSPTTKSSKEGEDGVGGCGGDIVYPWTFLAWCIVQIREYDNGNNNITGNKDDDVGSAADSTSAVAAVATICKEKNHRQEILSILQDHPQITHLMWKKYGSEIILFD